ncbi:hypothetical protein TRIP_B330391 [uncultured Desulfatiglans sp.]|nr:hypothetical protein TRIP_B330391 [uncultured Desulfatiglans sp.]
MLLHPVERKKGAWPGHIPRNVTNPLSVHLSTALAQGSFHTKAAQRLAVLAKRPRTENTLSLKKADLTALAPFHSCADGLRPRSR